MKGLQYHITCLCFILTVSLSAQDLHFSQFFNSPLTTNPANTGFIPEADFRLGAQYRNQWSRIMAQPYKTYSVFGDCQLFRDKLQNGWLGLGGLLLGDVAGSGSLTSTKIYGSIAYHQMLGNSSLLSAGFNVGFVNKRIDVTKLTFPDQFDGSFFDASLPTAVALNNTSVAYMDLQAGVNYAYFPTDALYINAGYSVHHVNMPIETFISDKDADNRIPMRHIAFVNASFKASSSLILDPNIYFTTQAGAVECIAGMMANMDIFDQGEKQLLAGLYYRYNEAFIPMLGFEINNIRFVFSYDATVSSLRNFNNMRGGGEFSLIKNGFYSSRPVRQALCPRF